MPLQSGTASPMAKHPRTLLRWDSSSPCHRRDGDTPPGYKTQIPKVPGTELELSAAMQFS